METEKWKGRIKSGIGFLSDFLLAALALYYVAEWLIPSCIHTRIGCSGESFFWVLLIKAGTGVLVAITFYLALVYIHKSINGGQRNE